MGNAGFFPGGKRAEAWSRRTPMSSAKVKNARSYTSTSPYDFITWHLVKHRDNRSYTQAMTKTKSEEMFTKPGCLIIDIDEQLWRE